MFHLFNVLELFDINVNNDREQFGARVKCERGPFLSIGDQYSSTIKVGFGIM